MTAELLAWLAMSAFVLTLAAMFLPPFIADLYHAATLQKEAGE